MLFQSSCSVREKKNGGCGNIVDSPLQQVISALKLHSEPTREEVDYRLKAEKCAGTDELRKEELEERAKSNILYDIVTVRA